MNKLKKILLWNFYLPVYLIILTIFNLSLSFLPLTKDFGYEFSAVNSMLIVFISGLYIISLFNFQLEKPVNKNIIIRKILTAFSGFLFIPFLIGLFNSIFFTQCSVCQGILFYLIITIPSVFIGGAIGLIIFLFLPKYKRVLFIIIYLLILLIPLLEFYYYPQVYFFNPIFGFYPGTIYDELLQVDLKLISYRILNLLFFGTVFYIAFKKIFNNLRISKKLIFAVVILTPLLFYYFTPQLGFNTTVKEIENELNGKIETDHFVIRYPLSLDENLVKIIALHHEYYYKELNDFFEVKLEQKINSFVFKNSEQKKKFTGSANADMAKPWLLQFYIVYDNYESTLKHEIAHIFTREFGWGPFMVARWFNPVLIEGAATAADPIYDENSIDYMAALAYNYGYRIDLESILSNYSFLTQTSSLSYIYAGSFSKYLIDNFGIKPFKDYYLTNSFESIYGVSLKTIVNTYYKYLENYQQIGRVEQANYYFGRLSIFSKVCPRYVAGKLNEGWEHYNEGNMEKAGSTFGEVLNVTNNYSALIGFANVKKEQDSLDIAIDLLSRNLPAFEKTSYYYNLEFRLADLLTLNESITNADSIYFNLINGFPNRSLFYLSKIRRELIKKDQLIKLYLEGNNFDRYLILRDLNKKSYSFNTFPALINLSENLDENYRLFLNQFNSTIVVNDYSSSYAVYKLSKFMMENLDFTKARKMAAFALRYNSDVNFNFILKENFNKMDWLFFNSDKELNKMKFYNDKTGISND